MMLFSRWWAFPSKPTQPAVSGEVNRPTTQCHSTPGISRTTTALSTLRSSVLIEFGRTIPSHRSPFPWRELAAVSPSAPLTYVPSLSRSTEQLFLRNSQLGTGSTRSTRTHLTPSHTALANPQVVLRVLGQVLASGLPKVFVTIGAQTQCTSLTRTATGSSNSTQLPTPSVIGWAVAVMRTVLALAPLQASPRRIHLRFPQTITRCM